MIRPIGHRVLVRPVEQQAPDRLIVEANPDPPVVGDVVSVGKARCQECGAPLDAAIVPGMRVALRPGGLVQEVRDMNGSGGMLWLVPFEDVIGEVEPLNGELHG